MSEERLHETIVESRVVHRGNYVTFRVDTVEDPEGGRHTRDIVEHPGAVAVVAFVGNDLLLVRQYRLAAGRILLEIPAGTLDRDAEGRIEDPAIAGPRELGEETGYRAATWRRLGMFWTAPGFASEAMTLYLATDLSPIDGYTGPEPDERLDLVRMPWQEALAAAERGAFEDAKTVAGILWVARIRGE
ncbi:MAG TPA: NUDIX hydrolase [Candidatus Saccharimonadia bacterium]|nr:NUDIX hydrolase [Candidatus Saccharimonadia bacterium]